MTATALDVVAISLEVEHGGACRDLASPLLEQLSVGYEECAVLEVPRSLEDWRAGHRTARKRVSRAERRGYECSAISREYLGEDIHEINISAPVRQGRPMSPTYRERQTYSPLPQFDCARHAIRTSGVFSPAGQLVAYLTMYRCGDLALVSQILAHADYEQDEVVYLLFAGALERELSAGPGFCVYNRYDSGTDGLRFLKDRLGFAPMGVTWLP